MVSINIFDVDSQNNDVPLLTLQSGEHVLGRGSLNCTDKRISRNHIVINVEGDKATLKSVHVNPCYFISFNQPNVQLLTKNLPVELKDGDKFAFLTDIWYRIKINEGETFITSSTTLNNPPSNRDSSATLVTSSSDLRANNSVSFMKRSLEEMDSSESRKKLKINDSSDSLPLEINEINTQDNMNKSSKEYDKNVDSGESTREVFRKKEISDSDDDSDIDMTAEVTKDTVIVTTVKSSFLNDKEMSNSDSGNEDVQSNDEPDSSNMNENFKDDLLMCTSELEKTNNDPSENVVKTELPDSNGDEDLRVGIDGPISNIGPEDNEAARKEERGDAADSSASVSGTSIANKLRREQCWYGASCYRKNASHRTELSHPGDPDYDSDPNDHRPECSYGTRCYRKSQTHRKQYKHPSTRPAPKPSGARKRVRRAARISYDVLDSADEDAEPFIADDSSSENYEDDISDSDLSGSVNFDGEENSEEIKIMYNEAKKFLKRERKN